MDERTAAQVHLLGEAPPLARPGFFRYSWFETQFRVQPALGEETQMTEEDVERYARGFLMFLFGTTIFVDRANTVPLCLLSALVDVRDILHYDWGGAALATLYGYMSSASRGSGQLLGGYWRAWELWVYAYFPRLAPVPVAEPPPAVPFSSRLHQRRTRRPRETFAQKTALKDSRKRDKKVMYLLYQGIDESSFEKNSAAATSKEAWSVLRNSHRGIEKTIRVRLQVLRSEFEILHMNENESISEYFNKTLTIVNQMRRYGEKIESLQVMEKILLRSLNPKF
ncbi:uncharacterized protein LOC114266468 [Camellia sinensis]|uniref:uncharacterized protein LOC114266468 n=1 Tax=Camellia sinensis TaxID=4442 RepID=UPI0010367A0A|nr:uncharacterized protein LOC114266468 [Camellia sinensis]